MKAGIALGSNIEPRLLHLRAALHKILPLSSPGQPVVTSRVYETSPVDCPPDSAPFLNAVAELTCDFSPAQLLEELQRIEISLGRPAGHGKNTPRSIDLDILYCDDMTLSNRDLTIPHPGLATRRFVLQPLADINPTLLPPNFTQNVEKTLKSLKSNEHVGLFCNSIY